MAPLQVEGVGERLLHQEPWGGRASLGTPLFMGEWDPPCLSSQLLRSPRGTLSGAWSRLPGLPTSCRLQVLMGLGAIPLRARLSMPALNRNVALHQGLTSCCRHSCSLYSEPSVVLDPAARAECSQHLVSEGLGGPGPGGVGRACCYAGGAGCLGSLGDRGQTARGRDAGYPGVRGELRSNWLNQLPLIAKRQSRGWSTGGLAAGLGGGIPSRVGRALLQLPQPRPRRRPLS